MKTFRYDSAKHTGLVMSFLGNGFLCLTFSVFMVSFLSGIFNGVEAGDSWEAAYVLWKKICDAFLPALVIVVILLSVAVRVLVHDAKGTRDTKITNKATNRSIFSLLVFMSTTTLLYLGSLGA